MDNLWSKYLDSLVKVPEERVKPEKAHQAEVSHHFVEGVTSKIPGDCIRISSGCVDLQLLVDVALVDHGVEHV